VSVVATTPRLLLRHWELADIGATDHIYGDAETMRLFGDGSTFSSDDLAASFPRLIADYARDGYGNYAVVERAGGRIIGHCGVRYIAGRDRVEADWALDRSVWGRGYGTEAATAVFKRAFTVDGIAEIFGVAHRDNAASIAIMRRLGMRFCEELTAHGVPSVLYAVRRADVRLPQPLADTISCDPEHPGRPAAPPGGPDALY
jgi:RimJ/RimL family protein N-acetyltransferase